MRCEISMPALYLKSRFTRSAAGFFLALLIAVLGWFSCFYAGLEERKAAEREDAWLLPVEVVITDLRGTSSDGLGLTGAALRAFTADKGKYDNVTYILPVDLMPWFSEIRVTSTLFYQARVWDDPEGGYHEFVGVTSLTAIPDFDPRLGTGHVTFFEGASSDFADAEDYILIVPESLLALTEEENGRQTLSLEVTMDDAGNTGRYTLNAEVTGYYSGTESDAIYCSWALVAHMTEAMGFEPAADSISAAVADNLRLEELAGLLEYYFTEPDPAGTPKENPHSYFHENYRFAAVIHDETLRETLKNFDRSIRTLKTLRPIILALELSIAASAAFFYVHMRKRELAVARSLGTPRGTVILTLFFEMLIWCALASAIAIVGGVAVSACTPVPARVALIDLAALAGTVAGGIKAAGRSGILALKEET